MNLNKYLEDSFREVSENVPGFISVCLIKGDDGTVMAGRSIESKENFALISPFHLQVYKQALKSLEAIGESPIIKDIAITSADKLYVMSSRTGAAVGVLTLHADKANLGITRRYVEKITTDVINVLKSSGLV